MSVIKTIGSSGQIALGKQYAGKHVLIDQTEPGVWVIKLGEFVPENERWLHAPEARDKIRKASRWAEANPPQETDLDDLEQRLET